MDVTVGSRSVYLVKRSSEHSLAHSDASGKCDDTEIFTKTFACKSLSTTHDLAVLGHLPFGHADTPDNVKRALE
jgi:hypothetical protein